MAAPLTHRLVKDDGNGTSWFAEISDEQWPGQAMTLRVKKILHVEQSLYQDVLVFESTDHGNVLVLDGAIQCVERDEFSYQEMITHLPLASHPNPVSVLVIGGGDGGVLREVLKHPSVKSAVLCDIDEAVPRVSKAFLPHMAAGFNDPRVTVHIGDGFKFLADKKCEFDVIITDSSDPVGPAESLFQKPYFQLLKESLKPGGSISTQGECIWLHLPLIDNLMTMTRTLFPVAEFGYTSIPTYPSGTIGFVVCTLDATRDLRTPLRNVEGCRYWSPEIHRAAFTLPTFAQKVADASRKPAAIAATAAPKKILLLGSGFVAQPCADYILRRPENSLTIGCRNIATAQSLASSLSREATAISVDVSNEASLDAAVKEHDLIISLIPYTFHTAVIKSAIKFKKNVVTTSYVSDAMKALEPACIAAGITVLNEIGLDPGIDHVAAVLLIDRVHREGGKIKEFYSYCGGLPAAEVASTSPLGYKFSWSSKGVLLALGNSARYLKDGHVVEIDGPNLMAQAKPYYISPAFAFTAYPNRDSTSFIEAYQIPEATTCIRGTLRFQGFTEVIATWVEMGLMNAEDKAQLQSGAPPLTWLQVTASVVNAEEVSEACILAKLSQLKALSDPETRRIVLSKMRRLGLFSSDIIIQRGTLIDVLCATLENKMRFEKGERDLVMLQHKFIVERADGKIETITSTLEAYGSATGGPSAMAFTVGTPAGIATQLILDGKITKKGVNQPYDVETCELLNIEFEKEGINMVEELE